LGTHGSPRTDWDIEIDKESSIKDQNNKQQEKM
jgi:hypothetical protein